MSILTASATVNTNGDVSRRYGSIYSQPKPAVVYYAFERSTATTPHDIIVFRGNNGYELGAIRDRTRAFLTNKGKVNNHAFKTLLISIREDKIGRGGLYTVVPCYNKAGLSNATKAELIQHFNKLGMREWVNTDVEPVAQPVTKGKNKVVTVINPVTYTKKTESHLSFVEAMNHLLKLDMVTLTNIAKDNGIPVSHNKVMMAKQIATQVKIARPQPKPVETKRM